MSEDKIELEEAINNLKKLVELRKNKSGEIKYDTCICSTKDLETVLKVLNNHTNEINKLQEELDEENKRCSLLAIENNELKENSIPKKKIENEIEILKAQCGGNPYHVQQTLNAEIRLLQKLLEGKYNV